MTSSQLQGLTAVLTTLGTYYYDSTCRGSSYSIHDEIYRTGAAGGDPLVYTHTYTYNNYLRMYTLHLHKLASLTFCAKGWTTKHVTVFVAQRIGHFVVINDTSSQCQQPWPNF